MLDPYIVRPGEEYDVDSLYEDGVLDMDYASKDLPENFFFDIYADIIGYDRDASIPIQRQVFNGIKASTAGSVIKTEKGIDVIHGPRQVDPPKVYFPPDYSGALTTMIYYDKFCEDHTHPFPYIPVAEPGVPPSMKVPASDIGSVDTFMHSHGALIWEPQWEFESKHDAGDWVVPQERKTTIKRVAELVENREFTFLFSTKEKPPDYLGTYYKAWFEFNPFHPMATPYILSYEDDGKIITGTYKWGRKEKEFRFNRHDKKYRIHSETWYMCLGAQNYYFSMFDLVANFDIATRIPQFKTASNSTRFTIAPIRLAEGFQLKEDEDSYSPYSYMMKKRRKIHTVGHGQHYYSYYSNVPILIDVVGEQYVNVTKDCDVFFNPSNKGETEVRLKSTDEIVCRLMKGEKTSKYIGQRFFVFFSFRVKVLRVYEKYENQPEYIDYPKDIFHFVRGANFLRCPRNSEGSLIRDIGIHSFEEYLEMANAGDDGFLRSMPVDKNQMEMVIKDGKLVYEGYSDRSQRLREFNGGGTSEEIEEFSCFF